MKLRFCPKCISKFLAKLASYAGAAAMYAGKAAKFMEKTFDGKEESK